MKTNSSFFLTAKKFWRTVVSKETNPDIEKLQQQVDLHKRLLNIFHAGEYYYYVFSMHITQFDIMSDHVKNVLGYESEELTVDLFMEIIHPDDKPYFLNFEYKVVEFFKSLPLEKVPYYKVQYDLRLRKKNGSYIRILHQAVQVDYDKENYYRTLSIDTNITHIKPEGNPCFSLIGLDGEPSYYNIQDNFFKKSFDLFTRREREILKEIIEGKTSLQIAKKLFISHYTVNSHRRNIMEKAKVNTPLELVSKSIKEGWI
ncbi:DNA-binding CsgD family transcriptional regulator [Chryseobacterium defluvii]|uniref:DNA-binding CsgD family transcriptional regulator n=1 Tax=Chryseobacterium defluvii TaxID=160396 RepID=A0A840K8I4_9FLAO|nr:LuxR C-terminal-related transcriptional regulator [Chryseobacterium defluvii]MBB4805801.1 DNA-binding CsgD family transcriptional regulator [Chryseobacterium defluvii]